MIEFEKRVSGIGAFFVSSHQIGGHIDHWTPTVGDQVTLKFNGVSIIAKLITTDSEELSAEIIYFENYYEEDLGGMKAGDLVSFKETNAFGFCK